LLMTWFIPKNPGRYKEDKFPNFSRMSKGIHLQGTPALDGRMVRISENSQKVKVDDADLFSKNISVQDVLGVRDSIKELYPELYPDPVKVSPFMDGFSKDGLPIVGESINNSNIILICGFSGQGFSQSPIMGEIGKDLVINSKTSYEIKHLSPERFLI